MSETDIAFIHRIEKSMALMVSSPDQERLYRLACRGVRAAEDIELASSRNADTITRLRAEVERLRAALEEIAKTTRGWEPGVWSEEEGRKYFASLFFGAQSKARAALKDRHD